MADRKDITEKLKAKYPMEGMQDALYEAASGKWFLDKLNMQALKVGL